MKTTIPRQPTGASGQVHYSQLETQNSILRLWPLQRKQNSRFAGHKRLIQSRWSRSSRLKVVLIATTSTFGINKPFISITFLMALNVLRQCKAQHGGRKMQTLTEEEMLEIKG